MLSQQVQPPSSGSARLRVMPVGSGSTGTTMPQPLLQVRSGLVTPSVVQAVTILWGLMLVPTGLAMIMGLLSILFADRATYTSCAVAAPLFALVVWFGRNLAARTAIAWKVQAGLSIIGIFCFPVGTIINALILAAWFSPDTKAWFGVD